MFLALLPMLLAFMGRLQGLPSQSLVDFSVINKYYIFQACHTYTFCLATLYPNPENPKTLHLLVLTWRRSPWSSATCSAVPTCCRLPCLAMLLLRLLLPPQRSSAGMILCCRWPGLNSCFRVSSTQLLAAQFITVFLGSFIAGSVLNQATTLFKNPTSIINILGTSAPLTSIFFLTYIELNVRIKTPGLHAPSVPLPCGVVYSGGRLAINSCPLVIMLHCSARLY